ncbi:MAG: hypothetical protein H6922_01240 [Pseudomonadaceae bacterium]|nr:hypothetical protein [Pseudomonadaceae bacterium]
MKRISACSGLVAGAAALVAGGCSTAPTANDVRMSVAMLVHPLPVPSFGKGGKDKADPNMCLSWKECHGTKIPFNRWPLEAQRQECAWRVRKQVERMDMDGVISAEDLQVRLGHPQIALQGENDLQQAVFAIGWLEQKTTDACINGENAMLAAYFRAYVEDVYGKQVKVVPAGAPEQRASGR